MKIYDRQVDEDLLLMCWWAKLVSDKELELALGKLMTPTEFMQAMQPPCRLYYTLGDKPTIQAALWTTPFGDVVSIDAWAAEGYRATKEMLVFVNVVFGIIFEEYPTVVCFTVQDMVKKLHAHIGCRVMGEIPGLFKGQAVQIAYITEEMFKAGPLGRGGMQ